MCFFWLLQLKESKSFMVLLANGYFDRRFISPSRITCALAFFRHKLRYSYLCPQLQLQKELC
jgi:hypothetical protein